MSDVAARGADLLDEPGHVLRRREAGLAGTCRPRGDEVVVQDLRGTDDRDALAVDRAAEGAVRLLAVEADPDDGEAVAPRGRERVAQALDAVVEPVVVGHRRDVDRRRRGAPRTRSPACGRRTPSRPASRRPSRRSRGSRRRDRPGGRRLDRVEDAGGSRRELRLEDALEMDVSAEREHDGFRRSRRRLAGLRERAQSRRREHGPASSDGQPRGERRE